MRWNWRAAVAAIAIVGAACASGTGAESPVLKPGDPAPPFALPGSDGKVHRLENLRGTAVVIAWFPKAFTGG